MAQRSWIGVACLAFIASACAGEPPAAVDGPGSTELPQPTLYVPLEDHALLTRASLALRGVRPSAQEHARLAADPAALDALVAEYVASDAFVDVMLEWANETLLTRTDTIPMPPALGELSHVDQGQIFRSVTEEPLKLLEHILDNDRPLTELVTADYVLADAVVATIWGLPYDPAGDEWQVTHWTDGRPPAGILSSAWLMYRYQSAGNNFHRARADMLADALLCQPFNTRDIVVGADVNVADEQAVSEAVATDPACIACHQAMDPLAGFFWGYKGLFRRAQILQAHNVYDCSWSFSGGQEIPATFDSEPADFCYPLRQYFADEQSDWEGVGLREPSYYSTPARDMTDAGRLIADDPRFSRCMANRVFSFLTASELESAPPEVVTELQQTLTESDFDLRALAAAVVAGEPFRAAGSEVEPAPPFAQLRPLRPSQFAKTLHDLTGYRWLANPDTHKCATDPVQGNTCWLSVDLLDSDLFGFRSMQGGMDSFYTIRPDHTVSPTRFLTVETVSWDAARYVVDADLALSPGAGRTLLVSVTPDSHESDVRAELADLVLRMHGEVVGSADPRVDDLYALFVDASASGDAHGAWTLVVAAMLQDPAMLFH